ncbi:MAG: hypothetical protein JWQ45_2811 [Blastococcus sp.]|nr:hypothetical protein [Blastococcus sp.]
MSACAVPVAGRPDVPADPVPFGLFVLKVASRCNLNCDYCYMYNKADSSWRNKPAIMSEETFDATLLRIRRHCAATGQRSVRLAFHGGEPTMVGPARFDAWCTRARSMLADVEDVGLGIQTNGTRIDAVWAEVFARNDVRVGVSVDGVRDEHDRHRVDHRGRGSYDSIVRGLGELGAAGVTWGVLSVIEPGRDPLSTHRHIAGLGADFVNYLWPDHTHDTIAGVRARFGRTPVADYLIPLFDQWLESGGAGPHVPEFWNVARLVLGGRSAHENYGNEPSRYVFVETDGAIEGLDVLRICGEGMGHTGLDVLSSDFAELAASGSLSAAIIMRGLPLPSGCASCVERTTCAGGYVPHRYSRAHGFDSPSVWCADILELFAHARARMGVTAAETARRRDERARRIAAVARG